MDSKKNCATEIDLRVCTIFSLKEPEALLHQHIKHWTEVLGVSSESLHYVLQLPPQNEQTFSKDSALSLFQKYRVPNENVILYDQKYTNTIQKDLFSNCTTASFARTPAKGNAWVSWSDSDEFPVVPHGKTILDHVKSLHCRGFSLYAGYMVDRVAAHGGLPDVSDEPNIFSQFPQTCALTTTILGAYTSKMVAFALPCLGDCYNDPLGSHHTNMFQRGGKCQCACEARSKWTQVAHFKWNAQTNSKLEWRVKTFKNDKHGESFWWSESRKMLQYLSKNGGRVNSSECFSLGEDQLVSKHIGMTKAEDSLITCDK